MDMPQVFEQAENESLSCVQLFAAPWYTVHGILQARILEWVAFPFSRGSSQPRDRTQVSHIAGRFFTSWAIIRFTRPRHTRCEGCSKTLPNAPLLTDYVNSPVSKIHPSSHRLNKEWLELLSLPPPAYDKDPWILNHNEVFFKHRIPDSSRITSCSNFLREYNPKAFFLHKGVTTIILFKGSSCDGFSLSATVEESMEGSDPVVLWVSDLRIMIIQEEGSTSEHMVSSKNEAMNTVSRYCWANSVALDISL